MVSDGTGLSDSTNLAADRRIVFLIDVDNTLLDNDRAKQAMDGQLAGLLGPERARHFWQIYEAVRSEMTSVDIPTVLARFSSDATPIDRRTRIELADLFMAFPFESYLYPASLDALAHLRSIGRVAILSDGDPIYQVTKIARSGLAAAVDGRVLVYRHKEDHVAEIDAALAADHYVTIDDKPAILQRLAARMAQPISTVFVRQGHYASDIPPGPWPGAGLTLESIGDVCQFDAEAFVRAGSGEAAPIPPNAQPTQPLGSRV